MPPTLILFNGNFYTQSVAQPRATAVACLGDRIVAVGDDATVRALAGPGTRMVDLRGRFAMPGLHDAHIHFFAWAVARDGVELAGVGSLAEMQARIRARLVGHPAGQWLTGQGWAETEWERPVMPHADDLDALSTEHPMVFWRTDMHGAVANRAALALAGITRDTLDPAGGVIERDVDGEPTGRFFETAISLVTGHVPAKESPAHDAAIREAVRELHHLGLTGVHDQRVKGHGEGPLALSAFGRLHAAGELKLRVTTNVDSVEREEIFARGLHSGLGDATLQLGHMKIFVDGSLGSQTAWMVEPFEGTVDNFGVVVTPPEEIEEIVQAAQRNGWAVSVHAIGDRANRELLDIFEELADERPTTMRLPHRIEHVQTIQPEDLARFAPLGIVASVQPIHATFDMVAVDRHWGSRGKNTYPFRQLLDSGVTLAFGSDCPVADPNPFVGIHAAVTRQRRDGSPPGGWYPAERLTIEEALWGYTVAAAQTVGRGHELGRLVPGFLADIIVLDRDLLTAAPETIPDTRVEQVVWGGEVMWDSGTA